MEIIKMGNDSFKISLSSKEAKEREIVASIACNEKNMTESLKELIDTIKESNGISFGEDKTSAEIYISKDGGCEIFVSRAIRNEHQLKSKAKPTMRVLYRLDDLDSVLRACQRLSSISYDNSLCLYHSQEYGGYYMVLSGIYAKDLKYSFLSEYGTKMKNSMLPYITEHCKCICKNNTLEIFSKLL